MTPIQLRIARLLLDMAQGDLAAAATVARATIHRYESGTAVGEGQVRLMRYAVAAAGIVFVPDGTVVDGVALYGGVGMGVLTPGSSLTEPAVVDRDRHGSLAVTSGADPEIPRQVASCAPCESYRAHAGGFVRTDGSGDLRSSSRACWAAKLDGPGHPVGGWAQIAVPRLLGQPDELHRLIGFD